MSARSPLFSALPAAVALSATVLFATATQATPRALSDAEMSSVRGADGTIVAGVAPITASNGAQNNLTRGLAAAFSSSTGATLLTPAEFASALAPTGLTPDMLPGYDGQAVSQTKVDAAPITFSFDVSAILQSTTGLTYSGPSMGTITMKDFDARGTTIWVWQHH